MAYKVEGRPLRYNGEKYAVGETVPISPADGDVLVSRGRLRKIAARAAPRAAIRPPAITPPVKVDPDQ